jgi:hypothetical protein
MYNYSKVVVFEVLTRLLRRRSVRTTRNLPRESLEHRKPEIADDKHVNALVDAVGAPAVTDIAT